MTQLLAPEDVMPLLDAFFEQHLPITRYLNMRSHAFSSDSFSLAIDLEPSLNDKLTAFGGSLYCVSVMCCWGMIYLQGRRRGINPNMVVTQAEIEYLAPVDSEVIVANCTEPNESYWDEVYTRFAAKGKARCQASASIHCSGKPALSFTGQYALVGPAEDPVASP